MTSRPVVGAQPPGQRNASAGLQRPPAPQGRPPAPIQDISTARSAGSIIDLTADADMKTAVGSGWLQQSAADLTGPSSNPPSTSARPTLPNLVLNDGSIITYDPDTFMAMDGKQSTVSSPRPSVPSLSYPPRPPPRAPERSLPTGDVKQKPERKPEKIGSGYALEKPEGASRYPDTRPIDFYPWVGQGMEDNLSVQAVEKGFVEPALKGTELGTARTHLWQHLKNKSGLSVLSQMFVQVMEKRQTLGRVTTPLQFKLPGRIAQNDKRREMWIKELADPSIPLRRLSARIPHGIKGAILLEQCLSKGVPTARAVWLAKCIGVLEMALEARARQRTAGASNIASSGGEAKWVREWTTQVQQFVQNTIRACGQPDWKKKIDYVIRFASHLYMGRLLDRAQFLDWILSSLAGSTLDELPIWLVLAQIYWKDLAAGRRRGCRLASSLLTHLATASSQPKAIEGTFHPLVDRLHRLLALLTISHRSCMVLPQSWDQFDQTLQRLAQLKADRQLSVAIADVADRNQRLIAAGQKRTNRPPSTRLIQHLDTLDITIRIKSLSSVCLDIIPSPQEALLVVLRWATSAYRTGSHRTYVAARLIRMWQRDGIDTDSIVISFLSSLQSAHGVDFDQVKELVAGLVLQQQFSVGRYMQWLIATGALQDMINTDGFSHDRLVAQLPMTDLPMHLANLRDTICHAELRAESDRLEYVIAKSAIEQRLPGLFRSTLQHYLEPPPVNIAELAVPIKCQLTRWLREAIWNHNNTVGRLPTKDDPSTTEEVSALTSIEFFVTRNILEQARDFPILADVLEATTTSADSTVLAAVADTLRFHALAFAVIGALGPICESLVSRYLELRLQRPPDRIFTSSLLELCNVVQRDHTRTIGQLNYDLSRCDQRTAIAMCSPASDNMAEVRDGTGLTPDEEIERILGSGNSMDESNFKRIFARITSRITHVVTTNKPLALDRLRGWFYRLRAFDDKILERLLKTWLTHLVGKADSRTITLALGPLLTSGCISMDAVWECIGNTAASKANPQTVLEVILPNDDNRLPLTHDAYHLELERSAFCLQNRAKIFNLTHQSLLECSSDTRADDLSRCLANQNNTLTMVKKFAIEDTRGFGDALRLGEASLSPYSVSVARNVLFALTGSANRLDAISAELLVKRVVDQVDDLSLPFSQLQLRLMQVGSDQTGDSSTNPINVALQEAVKDAIENNRPLWVDLLDGLDATVAQQVCQHAHLQLLSGTHDLRTEPAASALDRYLAVVDATASALPANGQPNVATMLRERIKGTLEAISSGQSVTGQPDRAELQTLLPWLDIYLHLCLVHRNFLLSPRVNQVDRSSFILDLCNLLIHPELQRFSTTMTYLYDVLAWFSDGLSDDVSTHITTLISRQPNIDPRLSFVFGVTPPPDSWLGIVTMQQPQSAVPAALRPAQQKPTQPLPPRPQAQPQRTQSGFWSNPGVTQTQQKAPEVKEMRPIPFPLRRWEILPEAGANDTALALTLFGARKVL